MMYPAVRRPVGGSQKGVPLSTTPKTYDSIRPSQNTGMETPMLAPIIVATSADEL